MLKLTLACCKVYISESRNKAALEVIERAAKLFPEAKIINKFEDDTYNRVGYTLVSKITPNAASDISPLKEAVVSMVKSAFEVVDLDKHRGSHPRLGVVDHICFHPLADSSLEEAASIARSLASEIGTGLEVPACQSYGLMGGNIVMASNDRAGVRICLVVTDASLNVAVKSSKAELFQAFRIDFQNESTRLFIETSYTSPSLK